MSISTGKARTLELRQVRYFLAVAETRHFTKAAQRLRVSQSTLSSQIKALERDLGTPLFDRTGRSVRLSAAGAALLDPAGRLVGEAAACRDAVNGVFAALTGRVRVGVTHVFSTRLVPRAVAEFNRRHPGIELGVKRVGGYEVRTGVISGRFDIGISYALRATKEIEMEHLFDDELVLIVPPGHPLMGRGAVRLAELAGHAMVLPDFDCTTRRRLEREFEERSIAPRILFEVNDVHAIFDIIRLGTCVTILPRQSIIDANGIEVVEIAEPRLPLPAKIFWPREAFRTAAARAFREVILQLGSGPMPTSEDGGPDVEADR